MKKHLLFLPMMATLALTGTAQTTAQDWTLTDCSSNSHNLFSYLDAEEVVVMEFGMGCNSCYTAATGLMYIKAKYDVEQPGKVNFFYMDYWNGNTCNGDVAPMLSANAFDAGFINCNAEKSYYMSGSPMPGIAIVAGSNHLVIFEKNSYATADTTTMITAIDNFFATVGINDEILNEGDFSLFPNPAENQVSIEFHSVNPLTDVSIEIIDLSGKLVYSQSGIILNETDNKMSFQIGDLSSGQYVMRIISNESVITKKFNKL